MAREFRYQKRDGTWSKGVGMTRLMAVAGTRVISGEGKFLLTQDGDPVTRRIARIEVLRKLRRKLFIGPVFRIRNAKKVVFVCREVRPKVPTSDSTNGNFKADLFYNWVMLNFKEYNPRYAGAYVCKNISGTWNLSQHSYGNAIDFFFDTLAQQEKVAEAARQRWNELHIYRIISVRRTSVRGGPWTGGTFATHYHLHVDFDPNFSGSCGVRG